jgi:hypothetical protein
MPTRRKMKAKEPIEARAWARTKAGNVKALFTSAPEQERALREEAFRRAMAAGTRRPDASAVLREVLGEWLAKKAKR